MPSINMNKISDEDLNEDDDEFEIDYEAIRRRREANDVVSKKLGELLLKGYKMLDDSCEKCTCVLMQIRNEPKICVNCDQIEKPPALPIVVNHPQQTASAIVESKLEESNFYDRDVVANKLSEYLLKGYKMLNSHCNKCKTILMQKRNDNKIFCVYCDEIDLEKRSNPLQQNKIDNSSTRFVQLGEQSKQSTIGAQDYDNVKRTLKDKILWATNELNKQQLSLNSMIELCDLIKSASNAIVMLEQLK